MCWLFWNTIIQLNIPCMLPTICLSAGIRQDVRQGDGAGIAHHQKIVQWYSTMSKMPNAHHQNRRVQQDVVRQLRSVALLPLWKGHQRLWSFLVGHCKASMILHWHTFYARLIWQSSTNPTTTGMNASSLSYVSIATWRNSRDIWKKYRLAAGSKFNLPQSVVPSDAPNVVREISRYQPRPILPIFSNVTNAYLPMCVYAWSDQWPYASRTMRNTFSVGHAGSTTAHCAGWGSMTNTWSRGTTGRRSAWGSATSSTGSFASVLHSIVQQEHRTWGA